MRKSLRQMFMLESVQKVFFFFLSLIAIHEVALAKRSNSQRVSAAYRLLLTTFEFSIVGHFEKLVSITETLDQSGRTHL